jgi:hypothetical protein
MPRWLGFLNQNLENLEMATPKFVRKVLSADKIFVDLALNVRYPDIKQYDIPQMRESILQGGRIQNPPSVEKLKTSINGFEYRVLRGNRRLFAAQEMLADPTTPAEIVDALHKIECLVYSDLTEGERMDLVVDHDQKSLSSTEVLMTVWRLSKAMYSEKEIASKLYFLLASYTGRADKLAEVPDHGPERATFLTKWFHGTLGNYLLKVQQFPEYVRESFLIQHKVRDGILPSKTTVIPVKLSQSRVSTLSKAKTTDEENGKWDHEKGGPAFIAQWQKFEKADKDGTGDDTPSRPSVQTLKDRSQTMRSEIVRKTLLSAAGEKQSDLGDLDEKCYRESKVFEILYAATGNGTIKPEFSALISAMIQGNLDQVKALVEVAV